MNEQAIHCPHCNGATFDPAGYEYNAAQTKRRVWLKCRTCGENMALHEAEAWEDVPADHVWSAALSKPGSHEVVSTAELVKRVKGEG